MPKITKKYEHGEVFRLGRLHKGLRGEDLAAQLGRPWTKSRVGFLERGELNIEEMPPSMVTHYANVLGNVTVDPETHIPHPPEGFFVARRKKHMAVHMHKTIAPDAPGAACRVNPEELTVRLATAELSPELDQELKRTAMTYAATGHQLPGIYLKMLRFQANLDQTTVDKTLGWPKSTVSMVELSVYILYEDQLDRLLELYAVPAPHMALPCRRRSQAETPILATLTPEAQEPSPTPKVNGHTPARSPESTAKLERVMEMFMDPTVPEAAAAKTLYVTAAELRDVAKASIANKFRL